MNIFRHQNCILTTILICILMLPGLSYSDEQIKLDGIDNKTHNLSEFTGKGKWVVLNIWATDCPPCRQEIPELVMFHDAHKDKDAIVVGVAIDFPSYGFAVKKDVASFVDNYLVDYPILLNDSTITEKLGAGRLEGLPTTIMYTPEGTIAAMHVGAITREILEEFIKTYEKKP